MFLYVGIIIYAIFEGVTEACTWNFRDNKETSVTTYHLFRLLETLAIGLMLIGGLFLIQTWVQLLLILPLAFSMAFLPYRLAFVITRGQPISYISPDWTYDIKIIKKFKIKYPHMFFIVSLCILGHTGYFLII